MFCVTEQLLHSHQQPKHKTHTAGAATQRVNQEPLPTSQQTVKI